MKLMQKWTNNLFTGLEESMGEKNLMEMLEECGRQCLTEHFKKTASSLRRKAKNDKEFLQELSKKWKALKPEKGGIFVVYPKCYCYVVGKFPGTVPHSYCYCSRGWIRELFEYSLGRPVKVDIISTIKRGDRECRFRVRL